jgi:SPP1 family predicted phage head-tail adaptor
MAGMRAGRLRHRVTIQEYTESQNTYGEVTKSWVDFATVWAAMEPARGREFWESQQINAETTSTVVLRYLAGVKPEMRVLYDGRVFQILSVINPDERNRELQLRVKEVVE